MGRDEEPSLGESKTYAKARTVQTVGFCYVKRWAKGTGEREPGTVPSWGAGVRQGGFHKPVVEGGLCGVVLGKAACSGQEKVRLEPTSDLTQKVNSEGII